MKTMLFMRYAGCVLLGISLYGCGLSVVSQPAKLAISTDAGAVQPMRIKVLEATEVSLDTGYKRRIPNNSIWRRVGVLPQGEVFRPVNIAFTIEGRHVHEAYLVLQGSTLAGFYLPGESAFSPLSYPPKLTIKKESND